MWSLATLPPSELAGILRYVDGITLAKLLMTGNARFGATMARTDLIFDLGKADVHKLPISVFKLRNLRHLRIGADCMGGVRFLDHTNMSVDSTEPLERLETLTLNFFRSADFICATVPDLSHFMPHLRVLKLLGTAKSPFASLMRCLPRSVEKLSLKQEPEQNFANTLSFDYVAGLPSTLTDLCLWCATVELENDETKWPPNLTRLRVSKLASDTLVYAALSLPLQLLHISMTDAIELALSMSQLPQTLTSLEIICRDSCLDWAVDAPVPPHLTELPMCFPHAEALIPPFPLSLTFLPDDRLPFPLDLQLTVPWTDVREIFVPAAIADECWAILPKTLKTLTSCIELWDDVNYVFPPSLTSVLLFITPLRLLALLPPTLEKLRFSLPPQDPLNATEALSTMPPSLTELEIDCSTARDAHAIDWNVFGAFSKLKFFSVDVAPEADASSIRALPSSLTRLHFATERGDFDTEFFDAFERFSNLFHLSLDTEAVPDGFAHAMNYEKLPRSLRMLDLRIPCLNPGNSFSQLPPHLLQLSIHCRLPAPLGVQAYWMNDHIAQLPRSLTDLSLREERLTPNLTLALFKRLPPRVRLWTIRTPEISPHWPLVLTHMREHFLRPHWHGYLPPVLQIEDQEEDEVRI